MTPPRAISIGCLTKIERDSIDRLLLAEAHWSPSRTGDSGTGTEQEKIGRKIEDVMLAVTIRIKSYNPGTETSFL